MNKKILITGGSGFIGSHLARKLIRLGYKVAITTKYKSIIDNIRIIDIWSKVKVIETDLRNLDSFDNLKKFNPDIVFHLAAYNHVGDSFSSYSYLSLLQKFMEIKKRYLEKIFYRILFRHIQFLNILVSFMCEC